MTGTSPSKTSRRRVDSQKALHTLAYIDVLVWFFKRAGNLKKPRKILMQDLPLTRCCDVLKTSLERLVAETCYRRLNDVALTLPQTLKTSSCGLRDVLMTAITFWKVFF